MPRPAAAYGENLVPGMMGGGANMRPGGGPPGPGMLGQFPMMPGFGGMPGMYGGPPGMVYGPPGAPSMYQPPPGFPLQPPAQFGQPPQQPFMPQQFVPPPQQNFMPQQYARPARSQPGSTHDLACAPAELSAAGQDRRGIMAPTSNLHNKWAAPCTRTRPSATTIAALTSVTSEAPGAPRPSSAAASFGGL